MNHIVLGLVLFLGVSLSSGTPQRNTNRKFILGKFFQVKFCEFLKVTFFSAGSSPYGGTLTNKELKKNCFK